MATLPAWTGGFNPGEVFSLLNTARLNAQAQQRQQAAQVLQSQSEARKLALAERELQSQEAARANDLAFKEFALQQNMTADQAKLALEREKAEREAQIAALQFQGTQDLQADISRGVPFEQAIQRHLPKIAAGNPSAISSFANTLNRTNTQELLGIERLNTQSDLAKLKSELDKTISDERNKTSKEVAEINAKSKLDSALVRAESVMQGLPKEDQIAMKGDIENVLKDYDLDGTQKSKRIAEIRSQYSTTKKNPASNQPSIKSDLPRVTNDADYQEIESGELYVDPKGNVRRKP